MTSVKDLIERSQRDDLGALEELVLLYQDKVYSHCCYLTGNPDDAQDLAQEVFIQAFKGIRSFRCDADFGTWLHRIAVNLWINFCRRNKKTVIISIDEPLQTGEGELTREMAASQDDPLELLEKQETNALVNQCLNRLAPEFRMVLVLREIEGYNYDQIAAMLGCSLGTVKSRINRGRKALKKELEKQLKV